MRRFITAAEGLPQWTSPISHAVVVDRHCYLSGQLSLDTQGRLLPGTAAEEAHRAFEHLFRALAAAGFERSDLVFIDIAFLDLADLPQVNAVYERLFPAGQRPARTVYQAAGLPFGGKVKVQGVAVREAEAGGA
ncbi:RidA family protein [Eleftheria terrae]|uniref:RidA family protein n=1 Tax=Eleftheria terrae TaxID=1597781 RepID=UPI00263B0E28|nr:RidA family protein [Eleftheria terrae]WKB53474.1 RidA family protein [Eleftheria terrae]